jgi:argininosuccinate synthase
VERIVFGYGGDLDTTVAIPWLRDTYHADVIAVTVDLGQGGDLEAVRNRALAAGAARAHVLDAREEFASAYVLPALAADAFGDRYAPLNDPLGRALLVGKLVEVAGIERAPAIAHGCHADGSARFAVLAGGLRPALEVIAPAREWGLTRPEQTEHARSHGIPVPPAGPSRYLADVNLWGRSVSGGVLDDLWTEAPEDVFSLTRPAADCPDNAAHVEIMFERGVPAAINGVEMPLVELLASLTTIAGAHGVGRVDSAGGPAGSLRRVVHEAPAAVILHQAHADLQRLVSSGDAHRMSAVVSQEYRDVILGGRWFTPLRESLDAYVQKTQERVTGTVRLSLFKGGCSIAGRQSPHALDTAPVGGTGNVRAFRSPVVTR